MVVASYVEHAPAVDLRQLTEIVDNVLSVVGLCLNSLLFFLISTRTNRRLLEYRPILLQNCIIDYFFTIINCVCKTQTDYKNGNFYLIMTGPLRDLPTPWNAYLIVLWVFSLFYVVTSVPVQFCYRYLIIVRCVKVTTSMYAGLLLTAFLAAATQGSISMWAFYPDDKVWARTAELLKVDPYYYRGIPNFAVGVIDEAPLVILFIFCYLLVALSYSITFFANLTVWRHLKSMESQMSVQTKEANKQMTRTLIVQAAVPCIICFVPITLAQTFVFARMNVPGWGVGVSFLWSLIPVANPLLTLVIVKNYRYAVLGVVCRFRRNHHHYFSRTAPSTVESTVHPQGSGVK